MYSIWFIEEVEYHVNGRLAEVSQVKRKSVLLHCKIYVVLRSRKDLVERLGDIPRLNDLEHGLYMLHV